MEENSFYDHLKCQKIAFNEQMNRFKQIHHKTILNDKSVINYTKQAQALGQLGHHLIDSYYELLKKVQVEQLGKNIIFLISDLTKKIVAKYQYEQNKSKIKIENKKQICHICEGKIQEINVEDIKNQLQKKSDIHSLIWQNFKEQSYEYGQYLFTEIQNEQFYTGLNDVLNHKQIVLEKFNRSLMKNLDEVIQLIQQISKFNPNFSQQPEQISDLTWIDPLKKFILEIMVSKFHGKIPNFISRMLQLFQNLMKKQYQKYQKDVQIQTDYVIDNSLKHLQNELKVMDTKIKNQEKIIEKYQQQNIQLQNAKIQLQQQYNAIVKMHKNHIEQLIKSRSKRVSKLKQKNKQSSRQSLQKTVDKKNQKILQNLSMEQFQSSKSQFNNLRKKKQKRFRKVQNSSEEQGKINLKINYGTYQNKNNLEKIMEVSPNAQLGGTLKNLTSLVNLTQQQQGNENRNLSQGLEQKQLKLKKSSKFSNSNILRQSTNKLKNNFDNKSMIKLLETQQNFNDINQIRQVIFDQNQKDEKINSLKLPLINYNNNNSIRKIKKSLTTKKSPFTRNCYTDKNKKNLIEQYSNRSNQGQNKEIVKQIFQNLIQTSKRQRNNKTQSKYHNEINNYDDQKSILNIKQQFILNSKPIDNDIKTIQNKEIINQYQQISSQTENIKQKSRIQSLNQKKIINCQTKLNINNNIVNKNQLKQQLNLNNEKCHLFINKAQAYKYESSLAKGKYSIPLNKLNKFQEKYLNSIFKKLQKLKSQNLYYFEQLNSFLRFPYQIIENDLSILNFIKSNNDFKNFNNYFQRIILIHHKCNKKNQNNLCKHLEYFASKLDQLII